MRVNKFTMPSTNRLGKFWVGCAFDKNDPDFMRVLANAAEKNCNVGTELVRLVKLGIENDKGANQ